MDKQQVASVRAVMIDKLFSSLSPGFVESPAGQLAVEAQTFRRYEECKAHAVPWVERHLALRDATVVEIGCGAGASTAAFAERCRRIHGYDIDGPAIEAGKLRMEIMGLRNTELVTIPPSDLLAVVRKAHAAGIDMVLCYAVLEHQTFNERIETLRTCWDLLKPGGVLVVADTPNRLTTMDHHTSFLPFFHMLPHEVAVAYAERSPRAEFVESIAQSKANSLDSAVERLIRWGRGVSYHDFEIALGALSAVVIGDGFDPEITSIKPVVFDERTLLTALEHHRVPVPIGFARQSVDVILQKPDATTPERVRHYEARNLKSLLG